VCAAVRVRHESSVTKLPRRPTHFVTDDSGGADEVSPELISSRTIREGGWGADVRWVSSLTIHEG